MKWINNKKHYRILAVPYVTMCFHEQRKSKFLFCKDKDVMKDIYLALTTWIISIWLGNPLFFFFLFLPFLWMKLRFYFWKRMLVERAGWNQADKQWTFAKKNLLIQTINLFRRDFRDYTQLLNKFII